VLKQNESVYTIKEICEDLRQSGYEVFNTHNLWELSGVLNDVLDNKSDEDSNRVYTKSDLNKLRKSLGLKNCDINYEPIRSGLAKERVSENVNIRKSGKCDSDIQIVKEKSIVTGPGIEELKEFMVDIVSGSLQATVIPELRDLKRDLIDLKLENIELKASLEKQQEEHFRQIDLKLTKWREESSNRRKPWYKKLLR
jgi:DNA-binding transcriptional MerR regulator